MQYSQVPEPPHAWVWEWDQAQRYSVYILPSVAAVNFSVHSKHSCPTTNLQKFAEELCRACTDWHERTLWCL